MTETRNCQNCKKDFVIEPEDFDFYKKIDVPAPTWCPECRAQRRLVFRNERALYPRVSSLSGKRIFSTYPEDAPFPVYADDEWYSDGWDPMFYGQDYDFNRPFLEQYRELSRKVARPAKSAFLITDSDYSNNISYVKNCYLIFNTSYSEDCAYGNAVISSRNSLDNSHVTQLEECYENFWMVKCNRAFFSIRSSESVDIYFCKNVTGCSNCFGCANIRNKSYCFFNEQLTKEEYEKRVKAYDIGSYEGLKRALADARAFWLRFPVKNLEGIKNDNVSGGYISFSKNVHDSYLCSGAEDVRYSQYLQQPGAKDCYDHTIWGEKTTLTYECASTGECFNARFCLQCYREVENIEYSEYCQGSSNLFGCISVRKKQYCILNKQYSKEEYEMLVQKIRKHMMEMPYIDGRGRVYKYGEFFPVEFSPYGYNETIAIEHMPLTQEQAKGAGFHWKAIEKKQHTVTLVNNAIPDRVSDTDASITKEIIGCAHAGICEHGCSGAFKVIASEFAFLKAHDIALPRLCPNCRHRERIAQRNPMTIFERICQCAGVGSESGIYKNNAHHSHGEVHCPERFKTVFNPIRPDIIYCESCYQQEVV